MNLAQRILRLIHPKVEEERMQIRQAIARACAEAEDVTRTVNLDAEALQKWLFEHRKPNGE